MKQASVSSADQGGGKRRCSVITELQSWNETFHSAGRAHPAPRPHEAVTPLLDGARFVRMMGFSVVNDEADEGDDLSYEVSDEALEAAAGDDAMSQTVTAT